MWPFDRSRAGHVVRVARGAVERWTNAPQMLLREARVELEPDAIDRPQVLVDAISALFVTPPSGPVTLVLESAWMPILFADTGPRFLGRAEREALVRHRFGLLHGAASVSEWDIRQEGRANARDSLAYGLAPAIRQSLLDAGSVARVRWQNLVPAFSWGWRRLEAARQCADESAWWLWSEQDRTLIARIARDEVVGLHPGACRVEDDAGVLRAIHSEAARLGVAPGNEPIKVADWELSMSTNVVGGRVRWVPIGGSEHPPAGEGVDTNSRITIAAST